MLRAITLEESLQISYAKMCNGVYDCPDKTDETNEMCSHMTHSLTCERWFHPSQSMKLPNRWVKDNISDCNNEADENEDNWLPICVHIGR